MHGQVPVLSVYASLPRDVTHVMTMMLRSIPQRREESKQNQVLRMYMHH